MFLCKAYVKLKKIFPKCKMFRHYNNSIIKKNYFSTNEIVIYLFNGYLFYAISPIESVTR
jgi:hypothetical protein